LPSITRLTAAFKPSLDALLPAAREVAPIIGFIGLYSRELTAAMANLGAVLQATAAANTRSGTAHYLRAVVPLNNESIFGQSVREPTNRHNTYYAPGSQTASGSGGLFSSDCSNTGNASQVPLPLGSGNVPCRVQAGFPFPGGTAYYPRLMRAPLPSK
jgi:hypothetical protein